MNAPIKTKTSTVYFANGSEGNLMRVDPDRSATEALALAQQLSNGISLLSERLADGLDDGDTGYCDEVRSLGFLGEVAGALIQSVNRELKQRETKAQEDTPKAQ